MQVHTWSGSVFAHTCTILLGKGTSNLTLEGCRGVGYVAWSQEGMGTGRGNSLRKGPEQAQKEHSLADILNLETHGRLLSSGTEGKTSVLASLWPFVTAAMGN
uniref:Uncharacterized protein n=1 Tax=Mustela putorius furo TaxID=9669 RepID=M3XMK7_MUSPF